MKSSQSMQTSQSNQSNSLIFTKDIKIDKLKKQIKYYITDRNNSIIK